MIDENIHEIKKSMNANEYLNRETFGRGKIFLI